jgi:hypothetical protein
MSIIVKLADKRSNWFDASQPVLES